MEFRLAVCPIRLKCLTNFDCLDIGCKRGATSGRTLRREDGNFGLAFGSHAGAVLAHKLQPGINVQMLRDMVLRHAVPRMAPKAPYRQTNGNNAATDYE
jgi:hypothetical protein